MKYKKKLNGSPKKTNHTSDTLIETVNNDDAKNIQKKEKLPINNLSNYDKKSDRMFLKTWRPHHKQWRYRKSRWVILCRRLHCKSELFYQK